MKTTTKILFSALLLTTIFSCSRVVIPPGQGYEMRTDTFDIYGNTPLGAELRLQSSTRKVKYGVLTNINDSGLTQFRKLDLEKVGTTGIGITGQDTVALDNLQYYLKTTGGNLTGNLGVQSGSANKVLIAMNLGGTSTAGNSTFGPSAYYLGLGHREWGVGTLRLMGMGFRYTTNDHYPVVIGYQEVSGSSSTNGRFGIWTRPVTTNTAPILRMTVEPAGNVKSYGPVTAPEDVATKGYVDTAYMPTKTITFTGTYSLNGTPSNTFVCNNASAANTISLPTAKDGITYTIWKIGGSVMTLTGAIVDAGKSGSKVVSSTEAGSSITVVCKGNSWIITAKNGSWTTQ